MKISSSQLKFNDRITKHYQLRVALFIMTYGVKYFIDTRVKEDKQHPYNVKTMTDPKKIKGYFIISSSPPSIYNRLKRSFNKVILDLSITPLDIVNLSRTKSSSWTMKKCNILVVPGSIKVNLYKN